MEELSTNIIREKIYIIRGRKVMFDSDLAMLYEVSTKRLNEAVKRNVKRFPEDFMFQLNREETALFGDAGLSRSQIATLKDKVFENKYEKGILRSQIATLNSGDRSRSQFVTLNRGGNIKYQPYVFTEQGIAMLSSVLKSDKAISVNIQIIRIFTKLREMIDTYKELREKVEEMERSNTKTFHQIFDIIKSIIQEKDTPGNPIGFTVDGD